MMAARIDLPDGMAARNTDDGTMARDRDLAADSGGDVLLSRSWGRMCCDSRDRVVWHFSWMNGMY